MLKRKASFYLKMKSNFIFSLEFRNITIYKGAKKYIFACNLFLSTS